MRLKAFIFFVFLLCVPTIGFTQPCGDSLANLSSDKIINEYADLAFSLEEAPSDSPGHLMIREALEVKGQDLQQAFAASELEAVKEKVIKRIAQLRSGHALNVVEDQVSEAEARLEEKSLLKFGFENQGNIINAGTFKDGKLSADGKLFLMVNRISTFKVRVTLISLLDGRQIFVKEFKAEDIESAKFLNNGKQVSIERLFLGLLLSKISPANIRTLEIFDTQSGRSLARDWHLEGFFGNAKAMDVAEDESHALLIKSGKIYIRNLSSKKSKILKYPVADDANAWFDSSSKNIHVLEGLKGRQKLTSFNIDTGAKNWSREASKFKISQDRKYIFEKDPEGSREKVDLIDGVGGVLIRGFAEKDLDISEARVGDKMGLVFIPTGASIGGYIYNLGDSNKGTPLEKPQDLGTALAHPQFFDSDYKISATQSGKVYVWDTMSGARLRPKMPSKEGTWFYGLDSQGSLLGTEWNRQPEADWQNYKNLQIWGKK